MQARSMALKVACMLALVVAAGCKSEDDGGGNLAQGDSAAGASGAGAGGAGAGGANAGGASGAAGATQAGGAGGAAGAAGMIAMGGAGGEMAGAGGEGGAGGGLEFPDIRGTGTACEALDTGFVGDEKCLPPPPEGEGIQIHIGPESYENPGRWVINEGEENSWCANFHLPNTEEVYYQGYVLSGRPGTHHIINTAYNTTVSLVDGELLEFCMDGGAGVNSNIYDTLPGASKPYMPRKSVAPENEGLGRKLPAGLPAQADMHYYNFDEAPLLREFWLNLYYMPKEQVTDVPQQIRGMGGIGWRISPSTDRVYQYQCGINAPGRIVSLLGHYHRHGVRFSAYLKKASGKQQKVFEMYDYNDPAEFSYDSVAMNPEFSMMAAGAVSGQLDVEAGDMLQWECRIINDSQVTLDYSNKVENGEMCNLWGSSVGPKINCVHTNAAEQPFTIE